MIRLRVWSHYKTIQLNYGAGGCLQGDAHEPAARLVRLQRSDGGPANGTPSTTREALLQPFGTGTLCNPES